MAQDVKRDDLIKLYLLGELSEQEHIEKRYFDDEDYFAQLPSAEDELIERYVREELSADERSRFEKTFPGNLRRKRRIETHKALTNPPQQIQQLSKDQPARLTWRDLLLTFLSGNRRIIPVALALLVLVVLAGLWQYTKNNSSQREVAANRDEQPVGKPDLPPQVAQHPPTNPPDANRPSAENSQGTVRGKAQQDNRQDNLANGKRPGPRLAPTVATFMLIPGTLPRGGSYVLLRFDQT